MIPRIEGGSGGGGTDTTDDSTDSDTSSDGSSTDYEYTYNNRYDADPTRAESGQPGGGDPSVDLTAPDANENTDGDGVFVDDDGSTLYDPSQDPVDYGDTTEEIIDRVADDDLVAGDDGTILNPADSLGEDAKTLTIKGGEGVRGDYTLSVSGDIARGQHADGRDSLTEGGAEGVIASEQDSYEFTGSLTNISLPEGATAYVNGEQVASGGGLPDLAAMGADLPGGTVELPGVGEVPVAGLALAVVALGVTVMEG